jgi:hypothetical protein
MIKFEKELLTIKYLYITKVSTHGIITHVENEVEKKLKCPKYIIQQFKKITHRSSFKKGRKSCILMYDGYPVSIETPYARMTETKLQSEFLAEWVSSFERGMENVKTFLENDKEHTAYIDGKFIFLLENKLTELETGEVPYEKMQMASDDGFYTANCRAFNLKTIGKVREEAKNIHSVRTCIIYHTLNPATGKYVTAVSPTVSGVKYRDKETKAVNFDKMDKAFYVNLNFILSSTKTVGESYGYDSIAFLDLEEILIKMNTVNLFSFPNYIRNITPIKQSFKECLSWIIGLSYRENKIEYLLEYRAILAGLLDSFLVKKDYIDNTFRDNIFGGNIPLLSKNDLEDKYKMLGELEKAKMLINTNDSTKFLI